MTTKNPFEQYVSSIRVGDSEFKFFDLLRIFQGPEREIYNRLPFSIRILLESAVRNCDGFHVRESDVKKILHWEQAQSESAEVAFKAARVILQDLTGVPVVVDLAAMRNAVAQLGGDPNKINPIYPVDLVIDHSVVVDASRTPDALEVNERLEYERNQERFQFLKWGAKAFQNMLIVPPGSGIVHQVNLEYLARVVFEKDDHLLYPDTVVGTDSHTTMINGLGVLGWGVGGIEAEAVMLGQAISMVLPEVVGFRLTGELRSIATSTDLVLTITSILRKMGVVNKFVEFFGPGCAALSIADRATISNMAPEYGATCGFFPVDNKTLDYLRQTGRTEKKVATVEAYLRAVGMFRDYTVDSDVHAFLKDSDVSQCPKYTTIVDLDLHSVVPCISGPKRPHDNVPVTDVKEDFTKALTNKVGFKGFAIAPEKANACSTLVYDGVEYGLKHGDVVIAAITSCTNTSNPSVMLGAGLVAKKAWERGLTVKPYIKTSLSPGSGVATKYLQESGLTPFLENLGFGVTGYGCMTCIGNSGPLHESVASCIEKGDLVVAGVLSGNRNFEGRIHPSTRANYLASPPLVVAYALAGTVAIDFDKEPIGRSPDGTEVYLRDIWPHRDEINLLEREVVHPAMFQEVYSRVQNGNDRWNSLDVHPSVLYPWNDNSTYVKYPPYFDRMSMDIQPIAPIIGARVLLHLGDSITTDHISPAGNIARNSPAARYLIERGIAAKDFNSYGSRRGHDAVMKRGTFANIRLVNKLVSKPGPRTLHFPDGEELDIPDVADKYIKEDIPTIILAGKEYGSGSSRDWAAKGPLLLGVKAVIAESYERIHRSNLIGMGIAPLQYLSGQSADSLGLSGKEIFTIHLHDNIQPGDRVKISTDDGRNFEVLGRFDTEVELTYFRNGGVLNYMVRKMIQGSV